MRSRSAMSFLPRLEVEAGVDQSEPHVSTSAIDLEDHVSDADRPVQLDIRRPGGHLVRMSDAMEPLYEEFGRHVRSRRTALGWSQARLGDALRPSLTRASIANIEAGQQRVLLHTALDISAALE